MSDPPGLLFAWERPFRFRWVFFGLLLLSAAAHVATFFLFQIVYPPRVTIPPPAPEVSLLLPTSPENRALLRRIEAEDPALLAVAASTAPPGLLEPKYRASYETVRTQPRTVGEETAAVPFPSAKDPLSIIRDGERAILPPGAPRTPLRTRVIFSAALAPRAPKAEPAWRFEPRATAPLESAAYLIGVNDRGEVRYVFLQHSSGESALDAQIAAHLPSLHFQPAEALITWGIGTVAWGDEAYAENGKSK